VIRKAGTEKDKSFCPTAGTTRYNKARSTGLCKRKRKSNVQRKTPKKARAERDPAVATRDPAVATRDPAAAANSASDNPFGDAFENIEMTSEQVRRDQELMEDVDKEIQDRQRAAAVHRQAAGDAVGTDGTRLYVHHPPGLPRNHGHNSSIERARYAALLDDVLEPKERAVADEVSKPKRVLKILPGNVLASEPCDFCHTMPTNHFCRHALPSSNITIQGMEGDPICGTVSCMECRLLWPGEPEDYANRCRAHKR
jgi:hypothetical protein